jgi:hypothetical protein
MIQFGESIVDDQSQISEWTKTDPYHFHQLDYSGPGWWLTGSGLLAFTLLDERGPLCYVRLDEEDGRIRIHTQFAPEAVVSKRRLLVGMIQCVTKLIELYRPTHNGMVFNSVSPSLIAFMGKRFGFMSVGNDDYRLDFEDK